MSVKVTMQDIADATGFSRNTVSKALNGNPAVPEATRKQILDKAAEMNYKHFAQVNAAAQERKGGAIALFTYHMPNNSHFGSQFISSFTERMGRAGYTLSVYLLQDADVAHHRTPVNFVKEAVDGILCIELFDPSYSRFLCGLGLPTLFTDAFPNPDFVGLPADLIMMENRHSAQALTALMLEKGARAIGFVGDKEHCNSFRERWDGYCAAMAAAGLAPDLAASILEDDTSPYGSSSWFQELLRGKRTMPEGFVCANDYIAISLVGALKRMGLAVPRDALVAGFDDSPESRVLEPRLTTVRIPGGDMGTIAAGMMLSRIAAPRLPYQMTYVRTELKRRESV